MQPDRVDATLEVRLNPLRERRRQGRLGRLVAREGRLVRQEAERGVLVLLHRPESAQELRQRAVGEQASADTKMDLRNYGIGAQILRDLNVGKMRLMAAPRKMPSMAGFGLEVLGYADLPKRRG